MLMSEIKNMLAKKNLLFYLYLAVFGIFNSLINIGILKFINNAIQSKTISFLGNYNWVAYVLLVVIAHISNTFFQNQILNFSYTKMFGYEQKILNTIKSSQLKDIEKIGFERIYAILEDLRIFVFLPSVAVNTINAISTIIISLVYLFIISPYFASVIIGAIGLIVIAYSLLNKKNLKRVYRVRGLNETYFRFIEDALKGFRELKLSGQRSDNLYEEFMHENRKEAKNLETTILSKFMSNNLLGTYGMYILFGLILFLLPEVSSISKETVISYIVILLFMAGPLASLFSMQQIYSKMHVAKNKIVQFLNEISTIKPIECDKNNHFDEDFEQIKLEAISYQQKDHNNNIVFTSGPINLEIKQGETIFVIGGNGSGKSTFINLLTNLYEPSSGAIYLDDQFIGDNNQEYRNLISAIYTDHYLFSKNYENYKLEENPEYGKLLRMMELEKVVIDDQDASARRKFSKGQSKRMALIFALLEEKPILVLDEWAADQDPYFRKYFYEKLLPKLKKEGKTIIAVTHDDAYFKYADRMIKFDQGKVVKDLYMKELLKEEEPIF